MAYRLFKNYTLIIDIYFVVKNIFSALVGKYLKWYSCTVLLKIPNYFSAQFTRNCKVRIIKIIIKRIIKSLLQFYYV